MNVRILKTTVLAVVAFSASPFTFAADPAPAGWKNESQAGVVLTSGNTNTSSLSVGELASYQFDKSLVKVTGAYLYQKNEGVVSGKSWSFGLRYEKILSDQLSVFLGQSVEGNRFSGLDQRYNTDLGAKYTFVKDDELTWIGEGGYRYTRENLIVLSRTLHYARAFTELEKKLNPTVSVKYWLEYLPNFTDTDNWQLNTELSLAAAVSSVFSIKSAYLIKYDNQINAPGLTKTDKTLTTSLVAKF